MTGDATNAADAANAFPWIGWLVTTVYIGLVSCFAIMAPPERIDRTGPRDDVIEDLEDRRKIW